MAEQGAPPRIQIPADLRKPARLDRLPADREDVLGLEAVARARGSELALSETKRAALVAIHDGEHALEERWLEERRRRNRPWWRFW